MANSCQMQLVFEVEPYRWSDRPSPEVGPACEHPQIWQQYFADCMADVGCAGLEAIRPGSRFVDAFELLPTPLMLRILRDDLTGSGAPGFPDDDGREDSWPHWLTHVWLDGGVAFHAGGTTLEPQCCSDLGTLDNWKAAVDRGENGKVWTGHPETILLFDGDHVVVRDGWDDPAPRPNLLLETAVSRKQLSAAITQAIGERKRLAAALAGRVCELIPDAAIAAQVAAMLVGDGPHPAGE